MVLPDYNLCPAVTIECIVQQTVRTLAWVYRHAPAYGGDPRRIVLAGHSASVHHATMLLACNWKAVAPDLPADIVKTTLSISGIYDLRPLRRTPFLAPGLALTMSSARRLSPASMRASGGPLVTVVGGDESDEFVRQASLIASAWGPSIVAASESVERCNHMNVLQALYEPTHVPHGWALRLLGLT